ncbi:MAG: hypothetical protein AB8H03_19010 [Saprospiraceae bacterium]
MNFKQLFKTTIPLFLLLFISPIIVSGQGGNNFTSRGVNYVEDSIFQFSINVLYQPLNQLSGDFETAKSNSNEDKFKGEEQKQQAREKAQATFGTDVVAEVLQFNVAGYCFIPIKVQSVSTSGAVHFYTEGFYTILTIWKSSNAEGGIPQPEEALLFFNNTTYTVEDGLRELGTGTPSSLDGVITLSENTNSQTAGITTSRYIEAPPVVFNTREFELVFLDMGTFRDLSTNTRFYGTQAETRVSPEGESYIQRPGGVTGIVIERSFLSLNPITNSTVGNSSIPRFDFLNYRSLIFKPYPIPDLRADYDAESAFAFSHGYACPPYWRPDEGDGATSSIITDDTPDMLRFYQNPPTPDSTLSFTLLSIANRVQNTGLVQPERIIEEPSIWNKYLYPILLLFLILLIIFLLIYISRLKVNSSNDSLTIQNKNES